MFSGFALLRNLSEIKREYSKTYPRYAGGLCLPVFISNAVYFNYPFLSLIKIVESMFPFIPYVEVLNSYSAAMNFSNFIP